MNQTLTSSATAIKLYDNDALPRFAQKVVEVFAQHNQVASLELCINYIRTVITQNLGECYYTETDGQIDSIICYLASTSFIEPYREVFVLFLYGPNRRILLLPLRKYMKSGYAIRAVAHNRSAEYELRRHGLERHYIVLTKP
jgi:hypothetical protein